VRAHDKQTLTVPCTKCTTEFTITAGFLAHLEEKEHKPYCDSCREEHKTQSVLVETECGSCGEVASFPKGLLDSLVTKGHTPFCEACQTTTTRSCPVCKAGFLTLAESSAQRAYHDKQVSEGKRTGKWFAPACCSKECRERQKAEATSEEGRTRGGKRK
jgi:hypothetical protein